MATPSPARKSRFIRKDSGAAGAAPDVAKRLAQELIVRDKVDIIAGFSLTPDALASADVVTEVEEADGDHECGHRDHHDALAIFRALVDPAAAAMGALGTWAAKSGIKKAYTMVVGLRPGHRFRNRVPAAHSRRAAATIVGSVRFPVASPDFSAFAQRLKDSKSEAVFIFVPGGEQPAALGKALAEHGITPKTTKILASGELTNDEPLKSMGDAAEGIITGWHLHWRAQVRDQREVRQGHQGNAQRPQSRPVRGRRLMTACT